RHSRVLFHACLVSALLSSTLITTDFLRKPLTVFASGTDAPKALESVRGTGCYKFGDDETPAKARRAATALAQEQAIRSHRVFIESSSRVKNFQLEEDVIQTASAAMLQNIKIAKEESKAQEICITMTAQISPVSVEDTIRQRVNAKEIAQ